MILAWHFVGETLRNGDPIPPDGEWLEFDGTPSICVCGLHASVKIIDALAHAPGATTCRVECDGICDMRRDKLVCTKRKILWRLDGDSVLRQFARWCANEVGSLLEQDNHTTRFCSAAAAKASEHVDVVKAARDATFYSAEGLSRKEYDPRWDLLQFDKAYYLTRDAQNERLTAMVLEAAGRTE